MQYDRGDSMATSYKRLWKLLIDKDMKKKDLAAAAGISTFTISKMGKGENVTTDVLGKICAALNCSIEDIWNSSPMSRRRPNNMAMKDYYIMSGDTAVAKWRTASLTMLNEALLPLYLRRVHNADMWLETRAIDSHRANSRLLKKALRLKEKDDVSTVIHVNGATITDNYWIKPLDSELTFADVRFSDDYFARLALKGTYDSFNRAANSKHSRTPELTNTGSFEKCWRLIDGKWWMYKSANHDEMFSELFIARFGESLDMNMAVYERGDKCVKTLDFTDGKYNFEPASSFMDDNDDYEDVIAKLQEICPQAIPDYVRMVFLDTIVANPDRHTANFGLLR